jgi:hypothetical protein
MAARTFLGTLRLAALLAVLVFVALGAWLDRARSRDWDGTLRVTVYPLATDTAARDYAASLTDADFDAVESFVASEAGRYNVPLAEPVRVRVSHAAVAPPPALADNPGMLAVVLWSLRLRWYAWRVAADDPLPTPDVQVFATFVPLLDGAAPLPDSVGLSKGLVAVAHLFAAREAERANLVVLTHELLHTLGATDKYDRTTGLPRVPDGLGEPEREPPFPQDYAEIMAGRIATGRNAAVMPDSLDDVLVGPLTAREIGWVR